VKDYPPFLSPIKGLGVPHSQWTLRQAKAHFAWIMEIRYLRAQGLSEYLGIEPAENLSRVDRREYLAEHAMRYAPLLASEQFVGTRAPPPPDTPERIRKMIEASPSLRIDLTDQGYALAADMGLLFTNILLESGGYRSILSLRGGRRDINYRLPCLEPIENSEPHKIFCPVDVAIGKTLSIASGSLKWACWLEWYDCAMGEIGT
jgi:hypothetical protein